MEAILKKYKVTAQYPVQWGDMDAARHVNNLVYLRWGESARLRYVEAMNVETSFEGGDTGPILGWHDCKYIFPMTYPDVAIVGIRAIEIMTDRLILECAVFSEKHQRIASISKQSIVPYSYSELKKMPMPEQWVKAIEMIEGGWSIRS